MFKQFCTGRRQIASDPCQKHYRPDRRRKRWNKFWVAPRTLSSSASYSLQLVIARNWMRSHSFDVLVSGSAWYFIDTFFVLRSCIVILNLRYTFAIKRAFHLDCHFAKLSFTCQVLLKLLKIIMFRNPEKEKLVIHRSLNFSIWEWWPHPPWQWYKDAKMLRLSAASWAPKSRD